MFGGLRMGMEYFPNPLNSTADFPPTTSYQPPDYNLTMKRTEIFHGCIYVTFDWKGIFSILCGAWCDFANISMVICYEPAP